MENEHTYRVVAWWSSGKAGLVKSDSAPTAIHFTAPPQFGGFEGRWSPEDLLLAAVASCYTTTFRALAEHCRFEYTDLEVEARGLVRKAESGYEFGGIVIHPKLTIASGEDQPAAWRLLQKAKRLCLISRTLSIPQTNEPQVQVVAGAETSQAMVVG
jgi:organic hydroperoxide reductase OsmC/OhrA